MNPILLAILLFGGSGVVKTAHDVDNILAKTNRIENKIVKLEKKLIKVDSKTTFGPWNTMHEIRKDHKLAKYAKQMKKYEDQLLKYQAKDNNGKSSKRKMKRVNKLMNKIK